MIAHVYTLDFGFVNNKNKIELNLIILLSMLSVVALELVIFDI